jgi:hypothetical protein
MPIDGDLDILVAKVTHILAKGNIETSPDADIL